MITAGTYVGVSTAPADPDPPALSGSVTADGGFQVGGFGAAISAPIDKGPKHGPALVVDPPDSAAFARAEFKAARIGPGVGVSGGLTANGKLSLRGLYSAFFGKPSLAQKSDEEKSSDSQGKEVSNEYSISKDGESCK